MLGLSFKNWYRNGPLKVPKLIWWLSAKRHRDLSGTEMDRLPHSPGRDSRPTERDLPLKVKVKVKVKLV